MKEHYTPNFSTIIPAAPGFFVLEPIFGDEAYPIDVDRMPVVAWGIDAEVFCAQAITTPQAHVGNSVYIQQPDGRVACSWNDSYPDEISWLNGMRVQTAMTGGKSQ
jgi:hypothetical protein